MAWYIYLKPYSLFSTLNNFKLEHTISLNNYFVFPLKQFATIQDQKQLATESGCIKIRTCVNISKLYTMYILLYMYGRSAPHCVFGCTQ